MIVLSLIFAWPSFRTSATPAGNGAAEADPASFAACAVQAPRAKTKAASNKPVFLIYCVFISIKPTRAWLNSKRVRGLPMFPLIYPYDLDRRILQTNQV